MPMGLAANSKLINFRSLPAALWVKNMGQKVVIFGQTLHIFNRVPTGQGKLEKVREFVWSGKGPGKYYF